MHVLWIYGVSATKYISLTLLECNTIWKKKPAKVHKNQQQKNSNMEIQPKNEMSKTYQRKRMLRWRDENRRNKANGQITRSFFLSFYTNAFINILLFYWIKLVIDINAFGIYRIDRMRVRVRVCAFVNFNFRLLHTISVL